MFYWLEVLGKGQIWILGKKHQTYGWEGCREFMCDVFSEIELSIFHAMTRKVFLSFFLKNAKRRKVACTKMWI